MRTFLGLSVLGLSVFLTTVTIAQQPAAKAPPATKPSASRGSIYKPVATVREIMHTIIDPSSKIIFDAVSAVETPTGIVQKAPKNDEEWDNVRYGALRLVEGANLLMMSGRHIASGSDKSPAKDGELPPDQIEKLVAKDRAAWNSLAQKFSIAAQVALKAANEKSADGISEADEGIDGACENCHLRFWYPDQEKLLADADKKKLKK
jgi:hypothetical protein